MQLSAAAALNCTHCALRGTLVSVRSFHNGNIVAKVARRAHALSNHEAVTLIDARYSAPLSTSSSPKVKTDDPVFSDVSVRSQRSRRTGYPACARYDGRLQHRLFSRENRRQKKFRSCARPPLAITAYSIARNSPPATYIFRSSDAASLLLTATASSIVAAI
jgi:hypothetical protein